MLRISAGLAIAIGLFLAFKTALGFYEAYRYAPTGEELYLTQRLVLQTLFAMAPIAGGIFAFWRGMRTLLAGSLGIVVGLTSPHLISPPIPTAAAQMIMAHGGRVLAPATDVIGLVVATVAVASLVLCGMSELRSTTSSVNSFAN